MIGEACHGTGVLPTDRIQALAIPVPSIKEQRAIARILGALDDKIELNRKVNATLEAMARALFKSWFVDFDPVRAKAEGRAPSGMDAETAKLFPSEFVESELGPIPKGWSIAALQDMTSYLNRGIGPAYLDDGGVCVLNQKCIRNHRVDVSNARRHDASKKSIEGRLIRDLDILVNSTGVGTLGRVAQIWWLSEDTIVDSHVTIVRAASNVDPWFLGVGIIEREPEIEALGEGSTGQTELSRLRLGSLLGIRPPEELQRRFGSAVSHQLRRIAAHERETQMLACVRDGLLPRLLSGELSVADAEVEVGAVA
jgi:type I restriction enzyme S subunit